MSKRELRKATSVEQLTNEVSHIKRLTTEKARTIVVLLVVVGLAGLVVACGRDDSNDAIKASGDVVAEQYDFSHFSSLEVANAFEADIRASYAYSVTIEADDNLMDLVVVSKDGDTLSVRLEPGAPVITGGATLRAVITMPALSSVKLSGASHAAIGDFAPFDRFEASLSGASSLDGEIDVTHVALELSGASHVGLQGGGTEADLSASGASSLGLDNFVLEIAHVTLRGASNGIVYVLDEIGPVEVSGASHLRYLGHPTLTGVNQSGASTIEQVEE